MKSTEPKRKIGGKAEGPLSTDNVRTATPEARQDHIATAAYYKAEARGFIPGFELDDWREAEAELNRPAIF